MEVDECGMDEVDGRVAGSIIENNLYKIEICLQNEQPI